MFRLESLEKLISEALIKVRCCVDRGTSTQLDNVETNFVRENRQTILLINLSEK
jgi:hypothetical protein